MLGRIRNTGTRSCTFAYVQCASLRPKPPTCWACSAPFLRVCAVAWGGSCRHSATFASTCSVSSDQPSHSHVKNPAARRACDDAAEVGQQVGPPVSELSLDSAGAAVMVALMRAASLHATHPRVPRPHLSFKCTSQISNCLPYGEAILLLSDQTFQVVAVG